MRNFTTPALVSLALAGAALSLSFGGAANAQAAPPAAAALTIDSPISDLLDNPGAHGVLEKDMPKLIVYPDLDQIKGMSLRQISQYPQAELDDAKLKAIQADLDAAAAAKPATPSK